MRALALLLSLWAGAAACADWVIVPTEPRVAAGARFEVVVVPPGQQAPDELIVQMGIDIAELAITMSATGPMQDGRRAYAATMPNAASGPVNLRLAEFPSNVSVVVARRSDAIEGLAGGFGAGEHEPLLSENEPMYFIIGSRGVERALSDIAQVPAVRRHRRPRPGTAMAVRLVSGLHAELDLGSLH